MESRIPSALLLVLLATALFASADSPPPNTIPIVGLKPDFENIDVDFLAFLSWNHFDGLSRGGYNGEVIQAKLVIPADSTGMLAVVNPNEIIKTIDHWARMFPITEEYPFTLLVWKNVNYFGTIYMEDAILDSMTPAEFSADLQANSATLDTLFNQETHSVWFYYGYDEAPAWQWQRILVDTLADGTPAYYNDFIPNLFTQAMDSVYRPDLELSRDTVWQPAFEETDPRGVLSWMNWYISQADSTRELGYIVSCMHTMKDWAGATNINNGYDSIPPNAHTQAQAVRGIFRMQYMDASANATPEDNNPSFIALDAYPYRLVGTAYQDTASYTPQLGDSLELWLIDHYETSMDSTFITAWNVRDNDHKDISVFFVPQSFGRAGGVDMWNQDSTEIFCGSYTYRIPTPQELRMTCNSALLRGATALFPFCLVTYKTTANEQDLTNVGFFDRNNMPFDAPYEDWVYTNRFRSDIDYIPPGTLPPFMESYDPLYTLPSFPDTTGERGVENYLMWKFSAYARLWNSAKRTLGDIARVAPELAPLQWWLSEGRYDDANILYDGTEPSMFFSPQVRVFTDSVESTCYLFYLNRFCRANDNPFEVRINAFGFPAATPFSEYALDHSRRFLIPGDSTAIDMFTFLDTLDAGEARLIEMIDVTSTDYADIRITEPDVSVILPVDNDTLSYYRSIPGKEVNICAAFYNMGMDSLTDLEVYLFDDTYSMMLDTQYVSFDGLDISSCYTCDRDDAIFEWTPGSGDIGVHRLRIFTESIFQEPDPTDNTARIVYVVQPGDYATEVLDDPWDMMEAAGPSAPLWHTSDAVSLSGWNNSLFTDSISGMFEGVLSTGISGSIMRGDFSLTVSESEPINTNVFRNLSFAAVCMNSNPNATSAAGSVVHLWWIDSHGDTTSVNISNESEIGAILNGDSLWKEYGPLDLSSVSGLNWSDEEAEEFWLSFRTGKPSAPAITQPVDIRIGWVKLTQ